MTDRIQAPESSLRSAGLSPEQLASEQAQDLPDREALSILDVGGLSGAFPVPVDPQPPVTLPDPSAPVSLPPGVPSNVDLTNVDGNVGDISDVTNVTTLVGPGDPIDPQAVVADATGDAGDDGAPAGLMQPSGSSTLA